MSKDELAMMQYGVPYDSLDEEHRQDIDKGMLLFLDFSRSLKKLVNDAENT